MSTVKPELTIIVTAYNNGLYIRESLESIYNQTYQNYKVIVVEDGSTDNTKEIVKEYIKDKNNFRLVELHENSGSASLPRNTGIELADTEYIMFLDGDDWYAADACEKFVNAIKNYGSDMVCGQVMRTNTYSIWFHKLLYSKTRININLRVLPDLLYCSLSVNKIYKREFLNKNNLRFLNGHYYEDILFISQAYLLAEKISIIDEPIYYWRVVENTENKSVTNQRDNSINFIHRIKIHDLLDDFMMENKDHIYLRKKNQKFLKHDFVLYLDDYPKFDENYKKIFKETMHVYFNKRFTRQEYYYVQEKNRIAAYLLHVGDFEAFEDYMGILSNNSISNERIQKKENFLYFYSDKIVAEEHFYLNMKKPPFTLSLDGLVLNNKEMSFKAEVDIFGMKKNDYYAEFYLENVHSKNKKKLSLAKNRFYIETDKITAGNHILKFDLYVQNIKYTYPCSSNDLKTKINILLPFQNKVIKTNISPQNHLALNVSYSTNGELLKAILKNTIRKNKNSLKGKLNPKLIPLSKKIIEKLPIKKNLVFFESHMGKQYSDSPKYIYEELHKTNKKLKYVWSFNEPDVKPLESDVIKVKKGSLKHYYYMNRAKYWVDNQGISHLAKKKKNQIYVQTWHGTPIKHMGHDQKLVKSQAEMKKLASHVNSWDYFISPNRFTTDIFKRAFKVNKGIIESGYPRNDFLIQNNNINAIEALKNDLNINQNKKVILFAPTFRDWDKDAQKIIDDVILLSKKIPNDYIILLRSHYLISQKLKGSHLPNNVIDYSNYDDVNHLYLVSDVLITDYSSVMFDYAILNRPILNYCYDYDLYVQKRGLYFDLKEEGPGPFIEHLEDAFLYFSGEKSFDLYKEKLNKFRDKYCYLEDGNASDRIIKEIFN